MSLDLTSRYSHLLVRMFLNVDRSDSCWEKSIYGTCGTSSRIDLLPQFEDEEVMSNIYVRRLAKAFTEQYNREILD